MYIIGAISVLLLILSVIVGDLFPFSQFSFFLSDAMKYAGAFGVTGVFLWTIRSHFLVDAASKTPINPLSGAILFHRWASILLVLAIVIFGILYYVVLGSGDGMEMIALVGTAIFTIGATFVFYVLTGAYLVLTWIVGKVNAYQKRAVR